MVPKHDDSSGPRYAIPSAIRPRPLRAGDPALADLPISFRTPASRWSFELLDSFVAQVTLYRDAGVNRTITQGLLDAAARARAEKLASD